MTWLLDTSVLIPLRDGDARIRAQVAKLDGAAVMSSISLVELEGGVYKDPAQTARRRRLVDAILETVEVVAFTGQEARQYGAIVSAAGYSRRKILDRMIAAQALGLGATLVTLNAPDFGDIPGLIIRALDRSTA